MTLAMIAYSAKDPVLVHIKLLTLTRKLEWKGDIFFAMLLTLCMIVSRILDR